MKKPACVMLFSIVLTGITTGVCASDDPKFDTWQSGQFFDEYGDPTGEEYIKTVTIGVFSNSATENSMCLVKMLVSQDDGVGLFLYDYGLGSAEFFNGRIQMKNAAGEEIYSLARFNKWSHRGGISIAESEAIIQMLKKSIGKVRCVVYDDYSSVYRFKINANGFTAAYNGMEKKGSNTKKRDVEELNHLEKAFLELEAKAGEASVTDKGINDYGREVENWIKRNWAYPVALINPRNKEELQAIVVITVMSNGKILKSTFTKRSSNIMFDKSVLRAIEQSYPLPAFPPDYRKTEDQFEITFNLNELEQ